MTKKQKQPTPKKGYQFTGWATFNWGICHGQVFRTRKEAQDWCTSISRQKYAEWKGVKDHFKVVKVKCVVE